MSERTMRELRLRGRVRRLPATGLLPACWAAELVDADGHAWLFTVRSSWAGALRYVQSEMARRL